MTPEQKRAAFYQAAANIEARPDLYDFSESLVGNPDCPACMWGHVGRVLGLASNVNNVQIARAVGFITPPDGEPASTAWLYNTRKYSRIGFNYQGPTGAASTLRAFADHHWPDQIKYPDWNAIAKGVSHVSA